MIKINFESDLTETKKNREFTNFNFVNLRLMMVMRTGLLRRIHRFNQSGLGHFPGLTGKVVSKLGVFVN